MKTVSKIIAFILLTHAVGMIESIIKALKRVIASFTENALTMRNIIASENGAISSSTMRLPRTF